MLTGRKSRAVRLATAALVAVAVGSVVAPSASADPDPSIPEVADRMDRLHHQAERSIERYNTINERVEDARADLRAVRADVRTQRGKTEALRQQVEQLVVAQVQGSTVDTTTQLLSAEDPDAFISSLVAMDSYAEHTANLLTAYEQERARLDVREQEASDQLAAIAAAEERAAEEKARTLEKAKAAEELLAELEEARAERIAAREARIAARQASQVSRDQARSTQQGAAATQLPDQEAADGTDAPAPPPASGAAATAVATALGQVGEAYVYGATGPDSFDCSGLTMYAWSAAGVSLPHSSSMQASAGVPVSYSDLQAGDLVFYYSPISHVGMYIGNGQLVHAANPSAPVEVVDVDLMPIAAIRRVG